MSVVIEQPALPGSRELMPRDDRPVIVGDLPAELRDHPRDADWARIPAVSGFLEIMLALNAMCCRDSFAARGKTAQAISSRQPANFLDQCG